MERTLLILKPDAVQRRLIGRILTRVEEKGLQIIALKMMRISATTARQMYDIHKGKDFYEPLVRFITSGPVVAMVVEGMNAIDIVRQMMGKTFGSQSPPGTIRGDFGVSNRFNLVHGSDSPQSAEREIGLFFSPAEIYDWRPTDLGWLYDMSDGKVV